MKLWKIATFTTTLKLKKITLWNILVSISKLDKKGRSLTLNGLLLWLLQNLLEITWKNNQLREQTGLWGIKLTTFYVLHYAFSKYCICMLMVHTKTSGEVHCTKNERETKNRLQWIKKGFVCEYNSTFYVLTRCVWFLKYI